MKKILFISVLIFSFISTVALAEISDGIVAYYPFNNNANDESINDNNGNINGASFVADRFNNTNSAIQFDGIDDYISCGNSDKFNFSNSYSFSMWVKPFEKHDGRLLNKWIDGVEDNGVQFTEEQKINFYIFFNELNIISLDSTNIIPLNQWTHVVAIFDSSKAIIFINGVKDSESSETNLNIGTGNGELYIGHNPERQFERNKPFNGSIDDIRIYSRTLSTSEISDLYNENKEASPPENDDDDGGGCFLQSLNNRIK